jgi:hypothetical protein
MKLRIWLVTWDRETWFTGAEITALGLLLVAGTDNLRTMLGLPLLAHLGYRALTSVPLGRIPGPPEGAKQTRQNQDLRSRVVGFLNEMRRVEDIAHQGQLGNQTSKIVERDLLYAKKRMMAAANEVVRAAGQVRAREATARSEKMSAAHQKVPAANQPAARAP